MITIQPALLFPKYSLERHPGVLISSSLIQDVQRSPVKLGWLVNTNTSVDHNQMRKHKVHIHIRQHVFISDVKHGTTQVQQHMNAAPKLQKN
jgi:hypothetical protein